MILKSEFLCFKMNEIGNRPKMHKFARCGSLRRSPDSLVGWRGDRRLRRLYSRALGTRHGACGASILPYHLYVRGAASRCDTLHCTRYIAYALYRRVVADYFMLCKHTYCMSFSVYMLGLVTVVFNSSHGKTSIFQVHADVFTDGG